MKLPFASLFQKKDPADYFLALLFRDEKIHAVVFEQINGRIQVVGQGKSKLTTSLERASDEMLLEASDKAISFAEESLPNGITTHKTVFGVKETWVEDTHITQKYLTRLKSISEQLDLKPIGFLVFSEAIAHLLQREEGAPVSAILVETGEKQASITLIRAGRIVGTKEVVLEESATATVENALKQFENVEIFPSRIILFDSFDGSIEKKFLTHHWSKTLPFLHVPQVTTLPSDFDTRAILFGTATQMNLDAIDLIKQPLKKTEASNAIDMEEQENEGVARVGRTEGSLPASEAKTDQEKFDERSARQDPELVDQREQDPEPTKQQSDEVEEVSGQDTSEYFGFVKNTDIAQKATNPHTTSLTSDSIDSVTAEIPEEEKEEELAGSAPGFSLAGPIFVTGAKKVFGQVKRFLPKQFILAPVTNLFAGLSKGGNGGINKLFIFVPIGIVVLLLLFFWYIFALHAKVTLFLTPKTISQDQNVTFTTTGATDPSKNLIAAESVSTTEDGKVSGDATGSKDVGTPAKGTVTIFNSDDSSHTLSSGTVITSSSGPKFTLDKDVTIASGSSDPTNLTAGTTDVPVTASSIGTESNLPSNTKFTISNTSVLAAKNANAFTGGTKKTITIVSQKDLDNLTAQLTDSLKDKAKSDLQSKAQGDTDILPDFTNTTPTKAVFDKKAGDESSSINLDGSITYETISYKKSDIEMYTKSALSGQLPKDLTLSQEGITYSVKNMTTKDGTTKATLSLKALLIPTLDIKTLSQQIAGKSFDQARDILSATPQFSDVTSILSPNLFFLPKVLPRLSGNINISIVAHE